MSWSDLLQLGITLRPFEDPPPSGETFSRFDAPLSATLKTLERELRMLQAKQIVLEIGYIDRDFRLDGLPRTNAKLIHDAVALSFTSKWGPLRYVTNEYIGNYRREGWKQNLRAIALAMEALRTVDRYGVSKRGEQYRGWNAIAAKSVAPEDTINTPAEARAFLDLHGGSFKAAAIKLHPDRGGDGGLFRAAVRCREILGHDA